MIFYEFIFINLILLLFNLIPLAPLDGEKILEYFLPANWARTFESIRPYGPMILMGLLFLGPLVGLDVIGAVLGPPLNLLLGVLLG
jgi:Zn-dependent protease